MKIILACEHQMIRESLRMLLDSSKHHTEIYDVENIQELNTLISKLSTQVLLCDSELPGLDIKSLLAETTSHYPVSRVIIFTDSVKYHQLKHQFSSTPVLCIDQPDSGEQILHEINDAYKEQLIILTEDQNFNFKNNSGG